MIREGSSPRGRGKRYAGCSRDPADGLIPAWAGKTPSTASLSTSRPAHPRVGGENETFYDAASAQRGSSPRGRGKRSCGQGCQVGARLIPAWAGKTRHAFRAPAGNAAHPRVGGENLDKGASGLMASGSSPRGRGKRLIRVSVSISRWLIPAWAGKTLRILAASALRWAHPRVGGENCAAWTRQRSTRGSSPRGRGKQVERAADVVACRLIPAWAGKTAP